MHSSCLQSHLIAVFLQMPNVYVFFFFRQSHEQDFANLPDPFGSYRGKLSYKDFAPPSQIDSQALGHIEDPKMLSYTQREISR